MVIMSAVSATTTKLQIILNEGRMKRSKHLYSEYDEPQTSVWDFGLNYELQLENMYFLAEMRQMTVRVPHNVISLLVNLK